MRMKRFKVLYIIFVVICVVYPYNTIMAPITFRHILSLLMLGVCVNEGFKLDKYLKLYCVFLLFLGVSSLATGYFVTFISKFLGTYIPIITAYAATYLLIKKYNGASLLVWLFVVIGVFNAVITIAQFLHLDFVDTLFTRFHLHYDEEFLERSSTKMNLEGFAIPGLFNYVINGYFLSASALLVLYNKKSYLILNLVLWAIVIIASLLAQERTGFFLAAFFSFFIIAKHLYTKNEKTGFLITALFIILVIALTVQYFDVLSSSGLRFSKGFEDDGRQELRAGAWSYLINNPLGGIYDFDAGNNRHPHNFFVNAFLYGGIFGGVVVIYLVILQVLKIFPYLIKKNVTEYSQWAFIWGLMYVDYTLNSMMHNASIMLGNFTFFIWWGAFLAFADLDKESKNRNIVKA